MATTQRISGWNPYGVGINIEATIDPTMTRRVSKNTFIVKMSALWETTTGGTTNYGMEVSTGNYHGDNYTPGPFYLTLNPEGRYSNGDAALVNNISNQVTQKNMSYTVNSLTKTTVTIPVTFTNFNSSLNRYSQKTLNLTAEVPAWTSYTVTYNANGGSGAPSKQTKWKNIELALSSTKPTKTGHTFKGWATSASATTATYCTGTNNTSNRVYPEGGNSNVTLYAVWEANTFAVSYNANGGTGGPNAQTKTYGVNLELNISSLPTRTNYNFMGWATSPESTIPEYCTGDANGQNRIFTANANTTLYAVWELAYYDPRISNIKVFRTDTNHIPDDFGTGATITFDYDICQLIGANELESIRYWTRDPDGNDSNNTILDMQALGQHEISGDAMFYLTNLDVSKNYTLYIDIRDTLTHTTTLYLAMVYASKFPIDFLRGGDGVSFGKPAEKSGVAEFDFATEFNKPVSGKALGMDRVPAVPTNGNLNAYTEPGCYAVPTAAIATTVSNIPKTVAGRLEVWSTTGEGNGSDKNNYVRQVFKPYTLDTPTYERDITQENGGDWVYGNWTITSMNTTNKLLWAGLWHMNAEHIANLSELITDQPTGIVLVFCYYGNETDHDWAWNTMFIPKSMIALNTGWTGYSFECNNAQLGTVGRKYLYIENNRIRGHASNINTGTANGVTYANNKFVLRYVIGV